MSIIILISDINLCNYYNHSFLILCNSRIHAEKRREESGAFRLSEKRLLEKSHFYGAGVHNRFDFSGRGAQIPHQKANLHKCVVHKNSTCTDREIQNVEVSRTMPDKAESVAT